MKQHHHFPMANESPDFTILGNESEIDAEGWSLIPYGDWKHADGVQRFNPDSAAKIVGRFKSTWHTIKRAITGLPVFNGHPDLIGQYQQQLANATDPAMRAELQRRIDQLSSDYTDHSEYGQIADMEVRDQGLALRLVLSNAGAALVKAGKKFISPNWDARVVDWINDRMPVWSPQTMNSVGLTSHPNIPVRSLVNSAAAAAAQAKTNQENQVNKEALIKLLGLANEATEEQITAAIAALQKRPEASVLANETTAKTAAEQQVTTLTNEKQELVTKLTDAQKALANERTERIGQIVGDAIRTGRILEAEKDTWKRRLAADFTAESATLANAVVKVKVASEIPAMLKTLQDQMERDLGNAGGKEPDGDENKGAKIKAMCNAEMEKLANIKNAHARYNAAFANVKRAHPELFQSIAPKE